MDGKKPEVRSRGLMTTGFVVSFLYLLWIAAYCHAAWPAMRLLDPNELGDFLAGVFSPLAFLWLVLGYLQQGEELKHSADALWLQGQELQNSVVQQRELVAVTREQLAHEREAAVAAERRIATADQAALKRQALQKLEAHNRLVERVAALGALAIIEVNKSIERKEVNHAGHRGTISGDLSGIALAELNEALPDIKRATSDVSLIGAIGRLQGVLKVRRVSGEGGEQYVAALEKRRDGILSAIQAVEAQRREEVVD